MKNESQPRQDMNPNLLGVSPFLNPLSHTSYPLYIDFVDLFGMSLTS